MRGTVLYRASSCICNFYTFFYFLALTPKDENEEDTEDNDSDTDGELMNMASDLMCSTPAISYDTLLFFVYVHFYSEDAYSYEKTWMTSEGKESK